MRLFLRVLYLLEDGGSTFTRNSPGYTTPHPRRHDFPSKPLSYPRMSQEIVQSFRKLKLFIGAMWYNEPFKYEAQTALFKDPVRTAQ